MKRILHFFISILLLAVVSPLTSSGQTSPAEADKYLKRAGELIKAQNYVEAYKVLDKAKNETRKLVIAQLENTFPAKIENWAIVKNTQEGMGMAMMPGGQNINITKIYEEVKEEGKPKTDSIMMPAAMMHPQIIVTVSNDSMFANNITMSEGPASMPAVTGEEVKQIKIKTYSAVSRLNSSMKMGSISILAGKGVVQISAMQIPSLDVLMKLAEAIDLNKISEVFGK